MAGRDGSSRRGAARRAWRFYRSGGVDQVMIRDGEDLARLGELDLKLWMALAVPVAGTCLDRRTARLIDADGDGRIRPGELLAAIDWTCGKLADPALLLEPGDSVPVSGIADAELAESARRLLAAVGKEGAREVAVADVALRAGDYAASPFNGDGIVPPSAAEDEETRGAMEEIIGVVGAAADRGGMPGLDRGRLEAFFSQAESFAAWSGRLREEPELAPLGAEATAAAADATRAVAAKIDDYFARCRLAAFDPRSAAPLGRGEDDYRAIAASELSERSPEVAAFPLALAAAGRDLPLDPRSLNPAWASSMVAFAERAAFLLLGGPGAAMSEGEWAVIRARLAPFESWSASRPDLPVAALGAARVDALLSGPARSRIAALIDRDEALASEGERIESVERLVLYRRDLRALIANFVNFSDFYGRRGAIFQAGTLYLDARACSLCIDVADEQKHAALASLSGMFLVYCDLSRPGGQRRRIAAAVTDGDSDNLRSGRNGVFYDRDGQDWDATVARIVSNPISVREAFWLPYKKLARMIEEQVAKRAQAGEAASDAALSAAAKSVASADKQALAAKAEGAPRKIDLGSIALIGTAIGGVSALVAGFFQTLFGLGLWLPLGVVGVLLLISGPSMILASIKLRRRNLGPLLDANGWAINTKAKINIPFGTAMTQLAALPPGTSSALSDPFADKKRRWPIVLGIVVAAAGAALALWLLGVLDAWLPAVLRRPGG
jgi:hypothetical protein